MWDFLRAAIVVVALVVLTLLVLKHYGQDENKAATILGIAAPVLAAVVGVSLGYWTGNTKGAADGKQAGAESVKAQLREVLPTVEEHMGKADASQDAHQALGQIRGIAFPEG